MFTMSELSSTVGGWVGCGNFGGQCRERYFRPAVRGRALEDAFALDAFQTDCSSVDHIRARSKSCRPTSGLLSDKCRSGDNSISLMSCLSKMHTTLLKVLISCASGPQFQLSRPRRMALLSPTYTVVCMSSTRNLSPSQAGSHTLVDA